MTNKEIIKLFEDDLRYSLLESDEYPSSGELYQIKIDSVEVAVRIAVEVLERTIETVITEPEADECEICSEKLPKNSEYKIHDKCAALLGAVMNEPMTRILDASV